MEQIELFKFNKFQTKLNDEVRESVPREVWEQLIEYTTNVKFIQNLIAPERVRGYAKDKPKETEFYNDGRIEVDLTNPHILEDMDYFRQPALFYQANGRYTHMLPNSNPKSEFAEFWKTELHRWKHGLVRESDGEWIPGQLYFYWNYSPIWLSEQTGSNNTSNKKTKGERLRKFPKPWLGDYLFYHYMELGRNSGKHGKLLKTRGVGFSFKMGSISPCNMYTYPGSGNPNFHLASDKGFLSGDKGIWGKVLDTLDWIAETTPLSRMRLTNKTQPTLEVQLGYQDEYGTRKGLLSSVHGISLKDNPDKARGIRGPLIHYEEDGLFPNLETAWGVNRKAVEDGDVSFGYMLAGGTGGTKGASFEGSEKLFYNPGAYNILGVPNVYDKNASGDTLCGFFWGAYLNRNLCYDENNGEPDVIKALLEILQDRFDVKYSSSDSSAITQKKAEEPITPQEAVMRTEGTVFSVAELKEYLESIAPKRESFLSEHYVGELLYNPSGELVWRPNADIYPIRTYDIAGGDRTGALEIFEMPKKNANNEIVRGRYIGGIDPVDSDTGQSLFSIVIMDTFTDRIVAEYSGRPKLIVEAYEIALRLLKFYNAEANYEKNLKGLFSYFDSKNALHYLCDTPQILRDMEITKSTNNYGNNSHPYSEIIYTPEGKKKWGDIKKGDFLFNSYGSLTKVLDIPFDDVTEIYEVSLKDGRKVKASNNHLWKVICWNNNEKIISTEEMFNNYFRYKGKYKEFKYYIPKNEGVEYPESELEIEPYLLGLLLGDGSPSNATKNQVGFTSNLSDLNTYKKYVNYEFKTYDDRHHRIVIPNIKNKLIKLKLENARSRTKFIPNIYKFNTKQVRLELLKGLMDTDGTVDQFGNSSFCTTSLRLHEDTIWLIRSLGINCNSNIYENKFGKIYLINIYTNVPIFNLDRKLVRQKITKTRAFKTAICNIEKLNYIEKSKCVTVDSVDSCYLINNFITTHNSKGTSANVKVNSWARLLQAEWQSTKAQGDEEDTRLNMHRLRSLAYIEECIKWNPDGNFDRVSAYGMLFILREDRVKRTNSIKDNYNKNHKKLSNDNFFNKNFRKPNSYN